jgi:hypothetical protein
MRKQYGRSAPKVDIYYREKAPSVPHDKVVVIEAGFKICGRYQGSLVRGDYTEYLFEGDHGEVFSLNKCKALSDALEGDGEGSVPKGRRIEIQYDGKKKLPGGKTFKMYSVLDAELEGESEEAPL